MNEHAIRRILEGGGGWPGRALRAALWFPGRCYGALMRLRRAAYQCGWLDAWRSPVPVVSVGNLTAGGSGKTPLVALLARRFLAAGRKPGILLRGYRKSPDGISDEAILYGELCPGALVEVGSDRSASARRAAAAGADVLIMDDGFQYLRLRRDLDIVLIDATSPWGGGNAFPGGLLREPKDALAGAGIVVVTRTDQVELRVVDAIISEARILAPRARIFVARHRPTRLKRLNGVMVPLEELKGKKVLALAGIARPEAFVRTLTDLGAEVVGLFAGRDHDHFGERFIAKALFRAKEDDLSVVITEKDRVKKIFSTLADNPVDDVNTHVLCLGIEQAVDGEKDLLEVAMDAANKGGLGEIKRRFV